MKQGKVFRMTFLVYHENIKPFRASGICCLCGEAMCYADHTTISAVISKPLSLPQVML